MNLQLRISSWLILFGLIAGMVAIVAINSVQYRYLAGQFEDMATLVAHSILHSVETAMLADRPDETRLLIEDIDQQPEIEGITIFRPNGEVWLASNPSEENLAADDPSLVKALAGQDSLEWRARGGKRDGEKDSVSVLVPLANSPECQSCHDPSRGINGAVRVELSAAVLNDQSRSLSQIMLIMGVIGIGAIVAMVVVILSRIIIRPLGQMVQTLRAFSAGNYDLKKGALRMRGLEDRDDELGTLARAFDEMAAHISKHTGELNERISELANEIARLSVFGHPGGSNNDFASLLKDLAATTRRLLQGDVCAVHLITQSGDELELIAAQGPVPFSLGTRSPLEADIFGWAARERQVAVVSDLPADDSPGLVVPPDWHFASLVVVPLLINNQALGVISVGAVNQHRFGEGEISLLAAVANQAAVSIQNARLYARVSEQSITDGLTGLYNHRYFHERLDEEVIRASKNNLPVSLLFCDIDWFKLSNDTFGHSAGDRALKEIAHIVREHCRSIDIPARYGGEEFAIILPECNDLGAETAAERIRNEVAAHVFKSRDGRTFRLTVSIGVASLPQDARTPRDLIDRADWAMYYAKRKGRDQTRLFRVVSDSTHLRNEISFTDIQNRGV